MSPSFQARRPQHNIPTALLLGQHLPLESRVVATIQRYDEKTKKWSVKQTIHDVTTQPGQHISIPLVRGGTIKIYPNLLHDSNALENIANELLASGLFRQYKIQSCDEPRLHFLLHDDAADTTVEETQQVMQPGYRYASITMKAVALRRLPILQRIAQQLAIHCNVEKWTIGVNPVLYRSGRDKMGDHADDDQGEEVILALLVQSPSQTRRVCIRPFKKLDLKDGDEQIELFMEAGDAYEMDGQMQKSYKHAVPPKQNQNGRDCTRIAVVFRTGEQVSFAKDSGRPCRDLKPRKKRHNIFGDTIPGLEERGSYSRNELDDMGAHLMKQRGVSGNALAGCDALIVSGLREDKLGWEAAKISLLMYAVESKKGALSVVTSFNKKLPIRVFRSWKYLTQMDGVSRPIKKSGSNMYRYDGLYDVTTYELPDYTNGPYTFYLSEHKDALSAFPAAFNKAALDVTLLLARRMSCRVLDDLHFDVDLDKSEDVLSSKNHARDDLEVALVLAEEMPLLIVLDDLHFGAALTLKGLKNATITIRRAESLRHLVEDANLAPMTAMKRETTKKQKRKQAGPARTDFDSPYWCAKKLRTWNASRISTVLPSQTPLFETFNGNSRRHIFSLDEIELLHHKALGLSPYLERPSVRNCFSDGAYSCLLDILVASKNLGYHPPQPTYYRQVPSIRYGEYNPEQVLLPSYFHRYSAPQPLLLTRPPSSSSSTLFWI